MDTIKFKIGDSVKLTNNDLTILAIGSIGEVIEHDSFNENLIVVRFNNCLCQTVRKTDIELLPSMKVESVKDFLKEVDKYEEPEYISQVKEDIKDYNKLSIRLKKIKKFYSKGNFNYRHMEADKLLAQISCVLHRSHIILMQHNQMKKLYHAFKQHDERLKMLYGLDTWVSVMLVKPLVGTLGVLLLRMRNESYICCGSSDGELVY